MTFDTIQQATRDHRNAHGCGAYTFEDGPGLTALAAEAGASRALELGTALGYTACCIAAAGPAVMVDTVELDPVHVRLGRENIAAAGLSDRISVHEGDFEAVMAGFAPGYDFAFFDGFAPAVTLIGRIRDLLVPGGMLACANLQMAKCDLAQELGDSRRWRPADAIEGGKTRAFIKQ
ncbi:O-methyltransferase [Amorphus sp. 3PC139-8]|uniref:O-methyltransferase n=1 Tax=Amorphus sp. 3PC139-8 TaxID=2735676 RepID=UPI00345DF334